MVTTPAWSSFASSLASEWGAGEQRHKLSQNPEQVLTPLKWEADPWQVGILTSNAPQTLVCVSRQAGKSLVAATKALVVALTRPGSTTVIISRSQRQAAELLRKVKMIERSYRGAKVQAERWKPVPFKRLSKRYDLEAVEDRERPVRDAEMSMEFGNGSRIISLPCSSDTSVGFTVDLLILDEAARIPDKVYLPLRPMLAIAQSKGVGQLLALSTPFGKRGWFWEAWKACEEAKASGKLPEWSQVQVKASECPRISREFLEREKRDLGLRWYLQEYETLFADAIDSVFSSDDVQRALVPVGELFGEV